ncbi:hypothetical protein ABZY81_34290 [Streptomyces sp. NPDC006514]|uniref:hypothetical protein n=1 Tax=Streptomyces sp. NPDC006514 TaxID=3154308 RepID=UPI0033B5FCA1
MREEPDFRIEAHGGGYEPDAPVRVTPGVLRLRLARVLMQEYPDGVALDRAEIVADRAGLDRRELARTAFAALHHQIRKPGV